MDRQKEWIVPILFEVMNSINLLFSFLAILSTISFAALSVKVTATTLPISAFSIALPNSSTRVFVLPEPGPAE